MAKKQDDKGVQQCPAGTVLFKEGEQGDRMYVIKSGRVQITKKVVDQDVLLEELRAGEFCGELALVNDQPRTVTAVVTRAASVIQIDSSQFEQMLKGNSDISLRMLKKISQRLTRAQYRISNLMLRSTAARLLHQLKNEVVHSSNFATQGIHHPTPIPDDIAEILALEIGEIKTLLSTFVRDELIAIDSNGYFQILDIQAFDRYLKYLELKDRFDFHDA